MTENQPTTNAIDSGILIIVVVTVGLVLYKFIQSQAFTALTQSLKIILLWTCIIVGGLLCLASLIYYFATLEKRWTRRVVKKQEMEKQTKELQEFLSKRIETLSSKDLERLLDKRNELSNYHDEIRKEYGSRIYDKFRKIEQQIPIVQYQENIRELHTKQDTLQKEVDRLENEKTMQKMTEESKIFGKKHELQEKNIYYKKQLSEQEIKLLQELGYKQANEYSILYKKVVPVFVKPINKHTTTHTFLVFETKRLLTEQFPDVINIMDHGTVYPDITFRYKQKNYALEIETGSLLYKKTQLRQKIEELNSQYRNRWMFIVSNKNLLPKYKKYGVATRRKGVEAKLQKMLKIRQPKNSGGKTPFVD